MRLNIELLEKRTTLVNGNTRARCPACAETGNDFKGEHLIIFPNGKYGCAVYPKDAEHRKSIFRLVGLKGVNRNASTETIKVSVNPKPGWS